MDTEVFAGRLWCPAQGELPAIAVTAGRIVAVGRQALDLAPGARVHRIDRGVLLPAFGDGHAHPMFGGLEADGPQIRAGRSVEEIVAEVARWAAENPAAQWIRGASYDSSLAPEGLFDARWLDAAVPDRPVLLRAWDYHTVWVNSRALELAGITADTPDPVLGEIPHRDDGSVLGTLREWGAVDLVMDVAGPHDLATRVAAIERAARQYAALGVTWVQDAWVGPDEVEAYLAAARAGKLPIAFNLALFADPRAWPQGLKQLLDLRRQVRELDHPQLTANTVKFFADGVVENETAAVLAPYCVAHPHDGMLVWDPDLLAEAVTAVDAAGFQPHIHTIGDRAVRVALDAVERAAAVNGPRDRRAVLAHVQLIDEADRGRLRELGVVVNAEPLWAQLDALMEVLTLDRLGPERSDTQYPWAALREAGATMSFGSDWPVSSADPLEGMSVACSRQTAQRLPAQGWTPEQRLSVPAALTCYTAGSAYQAFREAGTLEVGQEADLVHLGTDPFTLTEAGKGPRDLDSIAVLATWRAGRRVHSQEA